MNSNVIELSDGIVIQSLIPMLLATGKLHENEDIKSFTLTEKFGGGYKLHIHEKERIG